MSILALVQHMNAMNLDRNMQQKTISTTIRINNQLQKFRLKHLKNTSANSKLAHFQKFPLPPFFTRDNEI